MKQNRFENLTFLQVFQLLRHHLWIIPIVILLGVLVAYFYLRYATFIYKSEAELLIQVGYIASLEEERSSSYSSMFQMDRTNLLKSSLLIDGIVEKLKLTYQLYSVGKVGKFEYYGSQAPFFVEFIETSDSVSPIFVKLVKNDKDFYYGENEENLNHKGKFGQVLSLGNLVFRLIPTNPDRLRQLEGLFLIEYVNKEKWKQRIKKNLDIVTRDFLTFKLMYLDSHKERARDVLTALIQEYKAQELAIEKQQIEKRLAYLDTVLLQLQRNRMELEKIILSKMGPAEKRQYESLQDLYKTLTEKKENYLRIKNIYQSLLKYLYRVKETLPSIGKPIEPFSHLSLLEEESRTIQATFTELNALIDKYNLALNEHLPSSPYITDLKREITYRIDFLIKESETILNEIQQKIDSVNKKLRELEQKEIYFQAKSSQINTLMNNYQFVSDLYFSLLKEKYNLEIQQASLISNTRILQKPTLEPTPYKPNKLVVWSLAIGISIFLSVLLIILIEISRNTVKYKEDIEILNLTSFVLSEIIHADSKKDKMTIVVLENPRSIIAEEFRGLRNQINFILSRKKHQPKVILNTSTVSGEGKSFLTINLGAICSLLKSPTVILDADLRKPSLHKVFSLSNDIGISNYLVQEENISIEDLIQPTPYQNLDLIASGPLLPNPADFINTDLFLQFIEELKTRYSYILIDTPPIGIVKDAEAILPLADLVLYIVRMKYSKFFFLDRFMEIKQQNLASNVYMVLNDVPKRFIQYGYGSYYYSHYYHEQELKESWWNRIRQFFS